MCVNMIDYSIVRYYLTESLRTLELIKVRLDENKLWPNFCSEISYWVSSMELLRNCLYDCTDKYYGELDLLEALAETREEMSNAYRIVLKSLDKYNSKKFVRAWQNLKKAEEELLK